MASVHGSQLALDEWRETKPEKAVESERAIAPMLQQYLNLKKRYPEHLLLFQVGDFYEVFFDDAKRASQLLGIRLTSRDKSNEVDPVPMCGVPIHAIEGYLEKLLACGESCVLVAQVEDAKGKRGMVRREVTRIVTPGVRLGSEGLDEKQFNYLAGVSLGVHGSGAVCYVDVSTGHLRLREVEHLEELLEVLEQIRPAEVLIPSTQNALQVTSTERWIREVKQLATKLSAHLVSRPFFTKTSAELSGRIEALLVGKNGDRANLPKTHELSAELASTLDATLNYVEEVSFGATPRLAQFALEASTDGVFIDSASRRNLELLETRLTGERKYSLLWQIDLTKTPMGSRLLREWILAPASNLRTVIGRHESVEELIGSPTKLFHIREALTGVRDLERLTSRIAAKRASPRDLGVLAQSIIIIPRLKAELGEFRSTMLARMFQELDTLEDLNSRLGASLVDDPPVALNEGRIFRDGYSEELDRLRSISERGNEWLATLEARERAATGIGSLKVRYNNVFGYFLEVTKTQLTKVPAHYERKQTLVNAERFVIAELREFEASVLTARNRQFELERELFIELRDFVVGTANRIGRVAEMLSIIDVFTTFAELAMTHRYVRPEMSEGVELEIIEGRHPVVEAIIGNFAFVSNDTRMDLERRRFAILTGPNMGGKSTYLRQVGLIQLLAQAGSFVPARRAKLGMVDRIFTRIGASDDITRGDSTFMVEMREAAGIVTKATERSLVLIDEIGRGTATTDGLAIARAIAEWLLERIGCRTIFATHFHDLVELAQVHPAAFCLSVGIVENEEERSITFTHRIEERAAPRSYGIEVARLAGLPEDLLSRASTILLELEERSGNRSVEPEARSHLVVSKIEDPIRSELKACDVERLTPLDALNKLAAWKQRFARD